MDRVPHSLTTSPPLSVRRSRCAIEVSAGSDSELPSDLLDLIICKAKRRLQQLQQLQFRCRGMPGGVGNPHRQTEGLESLRVRREALGKHLEAFRKTLGRQRLRRGADEFLGPLGIYFLEDR